MPSNLSFLDTNFPTFTDEDSTEKKINTIQDYLYMTVESLRYALSHLNEGNMEQDFVRSIVRGDGSLAEITQRVSQNEADIEILTSVTSGHTQNIASLTQSVTADEAKISLVVSTSSGENFINAAGITAALNTIDGQSVSNINVFSDNITMRGLVTFLTKSQADGYYDANGAATTAVGTLTTSLAAGSTTIDGGCIVTNTLALNNIKCLDDTLSVYHTVSNVPVLAGYIGYATGMKKSTSGVELTNGMAMKYDATHYVICTSAGVRLQSGDNSIWVTDSGTSIGQAVFG